MLKLERHPPQKTSRATALVTKQNRSSYVQVTIITGKNQSAWSTVTQLAHESVGLCSLSWFVHEGIRELVNRIIKIAHAHNLHMKMLDFAPLKICTWKNAYCLQDYFTQVIKSPPFLTPAIKLCIIQCSDWYLNIITSLPSELSNCQNTDFYSFHVIDLAWISSDCFESFSPLSNVWIDRPLMPEP